MSWQTATIQKTVETDVQIEAKCKECGNCLDVDIDVDRDGDIKISVPVCGNGCKPE